MAEFFSPSGDSSDVAVPPPNLASVFVPGIDNPTMADGLGIVIPWGSGGTVRKYGDYGPSSAGLESDTLLRGLSSGGFGEGVSYNFEGLLGPQGIPGPAGKDGITTVVGWDNSNFLTALPENLDQINDLGTAADKLLYTSAYTAHYKFVWEQTSIAAIKSWNDSDINTDASFFIIAADAGIYVSTNVSEIQYSEKNNTIENIILAEDVLINDVLLVERDGTNISFFVRLTSTKKLRDNYNIFVYLYPYIKG